MRVLLRPRVQVPLALALLATVTVMLTVVRSGVAESRTWSQSSDFALGVHDGVSYLTPTPDQLQLNPSVTAGSWVVLHDSRITGIEWGKLSWNASVPPGANLGAGVRAADSIEDLAGLEFQAASRHVPFTAFGRFIEIETRLVASPEGESPVVFDLSVAPLPIAGGYQLNAPPFITSEPITSATEGVPYSYDVDAEDPNDGDVLAYSLDVAPEGMTIDPATGLIEWTPGIEQVGDNPVGVRVEDQDGLFDSQGFTIAVLARSDLVVDLVDQSTVTGDWQTLEVSGTVVAAMRTRALGLRSASSV